MTEVFMFFPFSDRIRLFSSLFSFFLYLLLSLFLIFSLLFFPHVPSPPSPLGPRSDTSPRTDEAVLSPKPRSPVVPLRLPSGRPPLSLSLSFFALAFSRRPSVECRGDAQEEKTPTSPFSSGKLLCAPSHFCNCFSFFFFFEFAYHIFCPSESRGPDPEIGFSEFSFTDVL